VDGAGSVGSNSDVLTITFGEDTTTANFGGDDQLHSRGWVVDK